MQFTDDDNVRPVLPADHRLGRRHTIDIPAEFNLADAGIADPWVEPPPPSSPAPTRSRQRSTAGRPTRSRRAPGLVFVSTQGCTPDGDAELHACVRVTETRTDAVNGATPRRRSRTSIVQIDRDNYFGGVGLPPATTYVVGPDLGRRPGRTHHRSPRTSSWATRPTA